MPWHRRALVKIISDDPARSEIVRMLRSSRNGMTVEEISAALKRTHSQAVGDVRGLLGGLRAAAVVEREGLRYRYLPEKRTAALLLAFLAVVGFALGIYIIFQVVSWILG